jgi:hypothetical protein
VVCFFARWFGPWNQVNWPYGCPSRSMLRAHGLHMKDLVLGYSLSSLGFRPGIYVVFGRVRAVLWHIVGLMILDRKDQAPKPRPGITICLFRQG